MPFFKFIKFIKYEKQNTKTKYSIENIRIDLAVHNILAIYNKYIIWLYIYIYFIVIVKVIVIFIVINFKKDW